MSFGNRIIERRKALGLSQAQLSKQAGVHKNVMGKYERDEVIPSVEIANNIAKVLGVSLDYLIGNIKTSINPSLLERLDELEGFEDKVQEHILYTFEALLRDAKASQNYS